MTSPARICVQWFLFDEAQFALPRVNWQGHGLGDKKENRGRYGLFA
jgi:hypothetical protein